MHLDVIKWLFLLHPHLRNVSEPSEGSFCSPLSDPSVVLHSIFFFFIFHCLLSHFSAVKTLSALCLLLHDVLTPFFSNRKLLSVLFYLERALSLLELLKDFLSLLFLLSFHRGTYVIGVLRVTISATKILRRSGNSKRLTTLITCFVIRVSSQRIFIVQLYLFFFS